jgi:hypothetical protein
MPSSMSSSSSSEKSSSSYSTSGSSSDDGTFYFLDARPILNQLDYLIICFKMKMLINANMACWSYYIKFIFDFL